MSKNIETEIKDGQLTVKVWQILDFRQISNIYTYSCANMSLTHFWCENFTFC